MRALLLLGVLAGRSWAAEVEPPPPGRTYALRLGNDAADGEIRRRFAPLPSLTLSPAFRLGLLAPFGSTGDPYSTLRTSPFGVGTLSAVYSGSIEAAAVVTGAFTRLNSEKAVDDPGGAMVSPAAAVEERGRFGQDQLSHSAYADLGWIASLAPPLKAALFVAGENFHFESLGAFDRATSMEGRKGASAGALVMVRDGSTEASLYADLRLEEARRDSYRNETKTVVPSGKAGVEVGGRAGPVETAAGIEVSLRRADAALRPYQRLSVGGVDALLAADLRRSRDPFFPDKAGLGTEVGVSPAPGLRLGISGSVSREDYGLSSAAETDARALATFDLDIGRFLRVEGRARLPDAVRGRPVSAPGMAAAEAGMTPEGYGALFESALRESPTMAEFARRIPVRSVDDILAALAAFTKTLDERNYNEEAPEVRNIRGVEEIYRRGRASYLRDKKDPILQCLGGAHFAAALAEELGRRAGIPVRASATDVAVTDAAGKRAGHTVAAVRTGPYGIVFVDWGKLTPTYTLDAKRALAVYQALQGVPVVSHRVTGGRDGRTVAYLFSDDGKVMVENLTFHRELGAPALGRVFRDDPDGSAIAVERYKALTRSKFQRAPAD